MSKKGAEGAAATPTDVKVEIASTIHKSLYPFTEEEFKPVHEWVLDNADKNRPDTDAPAMVDGPSPRSPPQHAASDGVTCRISVAGGL